MSSVFYPLGLIAKLTNTKFERTLVDPFESGATSTRRTWAAQNFKRHFKIAHAPLTAAEWRWLRSFYSQRNGMYDAFWFRDNVNRDGNAQVRFAAELQTDFMGAARLIQIDLDEIAPIRALPEFDEVAAAAGVSPLFWYDPNRELWYQHIGNTLAPDPSAYDSQLAYPAPWQSGSALNLGGSLAQYQTYNFSGVEWAKTGGNIAGLAGSQPACTVFAIVRHSTAAAKQILFAVGAMGASHALGLALSAANYYEPWIGGSETWTNARQLNSAQNTYRSIAITWAASSNNATLYANAASNGTDSNTRALTAGPASLGAAIDGTLISNPANALTNANLAHAMIFPAALSLAQIKALHNLLGYQYGLAIVP